MSELQGSIKNALDPLEYAEHVQKLSGNQIEPPTEWSAKIENEKKQLQTKTIGQNNKRNNNQKFHGFIYNPSIPVANCNFCKKKKCLNICHLQHWATTR